MSGCDIYFLTVHQNVISLYKTGFAFFISGFGRYIGFGHMLQWPVLF